MTANSFKCHSTTIGWHQVTYKMNGKWQLGWSAQRGWFKTGWTLQGKVWKKNFIGVKQRRARLRFAKDHKDWTVEDWSKVIFSDESNFQLCPILGHLMAHKPQCLAPTVKFGRGSVMIWGCFIKAGFGHICLCERCVKQVTYQVEVILEENFLHSVLTVVFTNYEVCIF